MREILFKAKRKDNGEWMEGYYLNVAKINHFICTGKIKLNGAVKGILAPEMYAIDPETLCRFTGQRYKCGKGVSENDIATISAYSYNEPESDTTGIVIYSEGKACWCLKDLNSDKTIPMYECYGSYITQISYIGNIFDNPDLLKAGES